jgi:hypothetical protein
VTIRFADRRYGQARPERYGGHYLDTAGDDEALRARHDGLGRPVNGLGRGRGLSVHRCTRDSLWPIGRKSGPAGNVGRLCSDLRRTAPDKVVYDPTADTVAGHQLSKDLS